MQQCCKIQVTQLEQQERHHRFQRPYDPTIAQKCYEEQEEDNQEYEKLSGRKDFFFAWECVSLMGPNSTIDFVIKDQDQLFCLLTVLNHKINKVPVIADRYGCQSVCMS